MKQPDYNKQKYWKYHDAHGIIKDKYFKVIDDNTVLVVSFGREKKKGVSTADSNPSIHRIRMTSFITNYNYYSKFFQRRRCEPISKKEFDNAFYRFVNEHSK